MRTEEIKDDKGLLKTRIFYFEGSQNGGRLARENYEEGLRTEYCEFNNNLKSGVERIYEKDMSGRLLEESLWEHDSQIEQKIYFKSGALASWRKYSEGRPVLEKEYDLNGRILKDFEKDLFPQIKFRSYYEKNGVLKEEGLRMSQTAIAVRKYFESGKVQSEKVNIEKTDKQFAISLSPEGHITGLSFSDESLREFILTKIPSGKWIQYKSKEAFHLMDGLQDLGATQEPKIPSELKNGWEKINSTSVYFESGLETPYFKYHDPKTDRTLREFFKQESQHIYRLFDSQTGELRCSLTKKIEEESWRGFGTYTRDGVIFQNELIGYCLSGLKNSVPVEILKHGLSRCQRVDGVTISETQFSEGLLDGPAWYLETWDDSQIRIDLIYSKGRLLSKKVSQKERILYEKTF